jgi:solute carrier family 25 S-adenosylmethionine transporter 26
MMLRKLCLACLAATASALRRQKSAASLTVTQTLVAGGASRAAAQLLMYPADALRTLAQTRTGAKTLAELGTKTLVNGCLFTSAFAFPVGAIQFAVLGRARRAIAHWQPKTHSALVDVQASACAALASCSVTVPQEVLKQRLIAGIYPNVISAVRNIAKTEGARGFFVGALPTAARNIPFVVVTFTVYGALSAWRGETRSTAESLGRGVTAALVAGFCTQPVDVVKTRMMTQAASSLPPYTSVGNCISTIARDEGLSTFYTGLPQRSIYMGPLWAIQFAGHDYLTKVFRRRNARRSSRPEN